MRSRAWLCLGPILACLLDGCVTLQGQPDAYWNGHYEQALEWNPLGWWPLQQHPLLFVLSLVVWALTFGALIVSLPFGMARSLAFAVQVGHTMGAASWLTRLGPPGWVGVVLLFGASRLLLDWSWRRAGSSATHPQLGCVHAMHWSSQDPAGSGPGSAG